MSIHTYILLLLVRIHRATLEYSSHWSRVTRKWAYIPISSESHSRKFLPSRVGTLWSRRGGKTECRVGTNCLPFSEYIWIRHTKGVIVQYGTRNPTLSAHTAHTLVCPCSVLKGRWKDIYFKTKILNQWHHDMDKWREGKLLVLEIGMFAVKEKHFIRRCLYK